MSNSEDLTREFKKILEKGIGFLKNIEGLIDKRTEKLQNAKDSLDQIEKVVEEQFLNVTQNLIPPISLNINNKLETLKPKVKKLSEAQNMISDIVGQLKTDVKLFSVKDLLKKVEELEKIDFTKPLSQPAIPSASSRIQKEAQKVSGSALSAPIPTVPVKSTEATPKTPSEEIIPKGEWRESELEGGKIFDKLITGWKLRDWEKIGGTKEMFMQAWSKLSNYDKQKIRSGTWSEPIMKKVKLLGREKKLN